MDAEIEAFILEWMRKNTHVLEEIVLIEGDDPTTKYGAAISDYLEVAADPLRFWVTIFAQCGFAIGAILVWWRLSFAA